MAKEGPETKLAKRMDALAKGLYGDRLVSVNYHGSEFGAGGTSDRLLCLDGMFVAIEIKSPESAKYRGSVELALTRGPTLRQRAFLDRVRGADGVAGVAATEAQYMDLLHVAEVAATGIDHYYPDSFPEGLNPYRTGIHGRDDGPYTPYSFVGTFERDQKWKRRD